jgi:Raf kinase inhibitor-like YbhB/YbcL family protein
MNKHADEVTMRSHSKILIQWMMLAAFAALTACASGPTVPMSRFELTSLDFSAGGNLLDSVVLNGLDCHGPNISPALQWSDAPAGTKGFALVLDDYEARGGDGFVHWAAYNIPAGAKRLASNAGAIDGDLEGGGRQAYNDFLKRSYGGPCPPEGAPHKYRFTIYALDLLSIDDAGTPMTWRKLRFIIKGHILGQASLTGLRGHS